MPTSDPYIRTLSYKFSFTSFKVAYKSTFFGKVRGVCGDSYKQYLAFECSRPQGMFAIRFYDTDKGSFFGEVPIPKSDICFSELTKGRHLFMIESNTLVLHCEINSYFKATTYVIREYNATGNIELLLIKSNITLLSKATRLCIGVIYELYSSTGKFYLVSHRNVNDYRTMKTLVDISPIVNNRKANSICITCFNLPKLILILTFPGPQAAGLRPRCNPPDGLLRKGSDKAIYENIALSFQPAGKGTSCSILWHYKYLPLLGGSFVHVIQSPNKHSYTSVELYKTY
jgi:hypothetical protein